MSNSAPCWQSSSTTCHPSWTAEHSCLAQLSNDLKSSTITCPNSWFIDGGGSSCPAAGPQPAMELGARRAPPIVGLLLPSPGMLWPQTVSCSRNPARRLLPLHVYFSSGSLNRDCRDMALQRGEGNETSFPANWSEDKAGFCQVYSFLPRLLHKK